MNGINPSETNDFLSSKICAFEFWPSSRMTQFVCDNSISDDVLKLLKNKFKNDGIKARIIQQRFTREECEKLCTPEQLSLISPRYSGRDYMTQIDVTAANKGDGVEFIQNKLKIPNNEIIMAGDGENDISMAKLSKKGRNFIGVAGLSKFLENYLKTLIQDNNNLKHNIILAKNEGLAGIIEGINKLRSTI